MLVSGAHARELSENPVTIMISVPYVYLRRAACIFVAVCFEYLRMRNFSVFAISSHYFQKSSIILLEYNTHWLQLIGSRIGQIDFVG